MAELVATTVWPISAALVQALDERLGTPVDSYVNGTQTWITDNGPGGISLEWRLHPVAGYRAPAGVSHYDVWELVVAALAGGSDAGAIPLGNTVRALDSLWEGLECFPAYGDEVEPAPLATAATAALAIAPQLSGLVDHQAIGDAWEHARGAVSLVALLRSQLETA